MLTDLIHRLETAPGNDRALFEEAFAATFTSSLSIKEWERFRRLLDAQAWESAVRMLLPEGWEAAYDVHFMDEDGVVRFKGHAFKPDWSRWTPHGDWIERIETGLCFQRANAFASACLKALEQNNG